MSVGNQGMQKLIETINRIQDASSLIGGDGLNLDLPQIAVVGGQSAGKSSVLENFVGRDFLPRGSGIVTRCPLVLQLIHHSNEEYGVFLHNQTKKFYDFNEIREEIQNETDRKIGNNKNVSSDPINLRVYSPNVLDLTLIDLPGITRNPVGDQPKDIEQQIIKVVLDYISRENCLILAVSAANQDLATSDAIKVASQVDPDGERTIGVLTKLDLMDKGTNARDILDNKVVPLKRGYIGVVNRSQSDITTNKDIKAAIEAEAQFFETHPAYKDIAHRLGTPYLQRSLNEQLIKHIKKSMPGLMQKLDTTVREVEVQQEKFALSFGNENSKRKIIFNALQEINNEFDMKVGLVLKSSKAPLEKDKLTGGALINRLMNEKYRSAIQKMSLNNEQMRREISLAITNIRGVHLGLFTPDMAFEAIVISELARFEDPSNICIDLVAAELLKIIRECCAKIQHYPKLRETLEHMITAHIEKRQRKVKAKLKERITMESSYMNTDHDDFVGLTAAMRMVEQNNIPKSESSETLNECLPSKVKTQSTTSLQPQIIHEGWVTIRKSKTYWFVLTDCSLSWYKRIDKKDRVADHEFNQATCMQPDMNSLQITLNFTNKKTVKVELIFGTNDEFNKWHQEFLNVGITVDEPDRKSVLNFEQDVIPSKQDVERANQVEIIRILVDSYLKIIKKTMQDFIPKLLIHGVINNTRDFICTDLHVSILSFDEEELLQVDSEAAKRRKELTEKYNSCKEALALIRRISSECF